MAAGLPIELWHCIATFVDIIDLSALEKTLNIDLSYIARKWYRYQYNAVINSINCIKYCVETYSDNCSKSYRTYQQYCVSYFGILTSLSENSGYYSCNYSYFLHITGNKYNVNGLIQHGNLYSNRLSLPIGSNALVNKITIYYYNDSESVSIDDINDRNVVIYPWSYE